MFEFKKLCDAYEDLSAVERGVLMAEKSAKIVAKLHLMDIPEVDPLEALAGFIVGSVVADGRIDEREYLLIYPTLLSVFGDDFDFETIKQSFCKGDAKKLITAYTEELMSVLDALDDEMKEDVVTLCLCVTAMDGRISLKEKQYVKRLCRV